MVQTIEASYHIWEEVFVEFIADSFVICINTFIPVHSAFIEEDTWKFNMEKEAKEQENHEKAEKVRYMICKVRLILYLLQIME